jgi:HAE1 family hydrophobic/amphiphilic exporter-1
VQTAVADLQQSLPRGVLIKVSSDESVFITGAVQEVARSLMISVVAVIAIISSFCWTGEPL